MIYLELNFIFCVGKFTIVLLSTIFITLITGSAQYVTADHVEELGQGIFKDEYTLNSAFSKDSKYQINLHVIVRNAQDQLVSVSEAIHGYYLPHQLTDQMIDKMQPGDNLSKEIVIIDNKKYEKVLFAQKYGMDSSLPKLQFKIRAIIQEENVMVDKNLFSVWTPLVWMEVGDVIDTKWNIFREFN